MRGIVDSAAIYLLFAFTSSSPAGTVGVYFDTQASSTCISDSLYCPVTAYLILESPSTSGGVAGWEGRFRFDPGILVSAINIYGEALNVGAFPNMVVGLSSPLPESDVVVLAEIPVLAVSAGGMWFERADQPSIPGSNSPIYVSEAGELRQMDFRAGDSPDPLAIIGFSNCSGYDLTPPPSSPPESQLVSISNDDYSSPLIQKSFPHGDSTGELGFVGAEKSVSEMMGIADFEVGEGGYVYILDYVNSRLVILDENLNWTGEVPTTESLVSMQYYRGELILDDREGHQFRLVRDPSGMTSIAAVFAPQQKIVRPGSRSKSQPPLTLRGRRVDPRKFILEGLLSAEKAGKETTLFDWQVSLTRDAVGIALASDDIVQNTVYLRIDYSSDYSNFRSDVAVVELDGTVANIVELPDSRFTEYRLPISTKAGLDGSIVTVLVYDSHTEVTKWAF